MRNECPKISIVTPSFQQAAYLEQTIDSVLSQGYPNLEYIVVDGGSTDRSVEIIKRHERHLAYWVSEKDRGQTHAINKGLERSTGDIIAYINSDDYYLPGAFERVADAFLSDPNRDLIHGRCRMIDAAGNKTGEQFGSIERFDEIVDLWGVWWGGRQFVQPEVFWTRRIMDRVGPFREELFFAMDYDYWLRILRARGLVGRIDAELSCFRLTPAQKSSRAIEVADELRGIVHPWIWDRSAPISWSKRVNLKGKWLFDSVFRTEAARSVANRESRFVRWRKLSSLAIRHQHMFATSSFWRHAAENCKAQLTNARS
jgi:glycosyltransferase involved in cell wall biosynthesis